MRAANKAQEPSMTTDELMARTSRTFALAVPLLPHKTRRAVSLSYLLFRTADTLEDADVWDRDTRLEGLADFVALLQRVDQSQAKSLSRKWLDLRPTSHDGYLALIDALPIVLAELSALEPAVQSIVKTHAIRTAQGMASFIRRADHRGSLALTDLPDLMAYCYVVAGIVGELFTAGFLHDAP